MDFCKRCGSIILDGNCYNCSGSNIVFHLPFGIPDRLERSFFSPTEELERRMKSNTQLEDKTDFIPKFKQCLLIKKNFLITLEI